MSASGNEILIFLPTYNEAGHIEQTLKRIRATGIAADVMFLDDNSADGTGEIIDRLARKRTKPCLPSIALTSLELAAPIDELLSMHMMQAIAF